jgi:hypothetical protein
MVSRKAQPSADLLARDRRRVHGFDRVFLAR